jgi:hypothetical protein
MLEVGGNFFKICTRNEEKRKSNPTTSSHPKYRAGLP